MRVRNLKTALCLGVGPLRPIAKRRALPAIAQESRRRITRTLQTVDRSPATEGGSKRSRRSGRRFGALIESVHRESQILDLKISSRSLPSLSVGPAPVVVPIYELVIRGFWQTANNAGMSPSVACVHRWRVVRVRRRRFGPAEYRSAFEVLRGPSVDAVWERIGLRPVSLG